MQEIAFLSLRKSKIFWGTMPPDRPSQVSWSIKNPSYTPDSSCNIRICRAQLFKAEIIENCYAFSNESGFLINDINFHALYSMLCIATHQESVWIYISVVGRSHFVITPPSQNLYVRPCLVSSLVEFFN